jgi:hypothetical protein
VTGDNNYDQNSEIYLFDPVFNHVRMPGGELDRFHFRRLYSFGETLYYPGICAREWAVYFFRFKAAVWMSGAILLFGTANLVSFTSGTNTFSIMSSPDIETRSFLILIVYGVIDFGVYGYLFFSRRSMADGDNLRKK